jgi:hypothetical protein
MATKKSSEMNASTTNTDRARLGIGAGLLQCAGMVAAAFLVNAGTAIGFAFAVPTLIAVLKINFFRSFRDPVLELPKKPDFEGWNPG